MADFLSKLKSNIGEHAEDTSYSVKRQHFADGGQVGTPHTFTCDSSLKNKGSSEVTLASMKRIWSNSEGVPSFKKGGSVAESKEAKLDLSDYHPKSEGDIPESHISNVDSSVIMPTSDRPGSEDNRLPPGGLPPSAVVSALAGLNNDPRLGRLEPIYPSRQIRGLDGDYLSRGMSANNIKEYLDKKGDLSFRIRRDDLSPLDIRNRGVVRNNVIDHVLVDKPASPFFSTEINSNGISAGKYALKPITQDNGLHGVTYDPQDGYYTIPKSYVRGHLDEHAPRKGYIATTKGTSVSGHNKINLSDKRCVERFKRDYDVIKRDFDTPQIRKAIDKDPESVFNTRAINDKEVLVDGSSRLPVDLVEKVKEVTPEYYVSKYNKQNPHKKVVQYKKPREDFWRYYKSSIPIQFRDKYRYTDSVINDEFPKDASSISTISDINRQSFDEARDKRVA
jgi:hypothetical protein